MVNLVPVGSVTLREIVHRGAPGAHLRIGLELANDPGLGLRNVALGVEVAGGKGIPGLGRCTAGGGLGGDRLVQLGDRLRYVVGRTVSAGKRYDQVGAGITKLTRLQQVRDGRGFLLLVESAIEPRTLLYDASASVGVLGFGISMSSALATPSLSFFELAICRWKMPTK